MKILIVDDHPMFLDGIVSAMDVADIVAETLTTTNVTEALYLVQQHPEIALVLTDLQMPDQSGEDLIRQVKIPRPDLPVLIVSASESVNRIAEAVRSGAKGFVSKSAASQSLIQAIGLCAKGEEYLEPDMRAAIEAYFAARETLHITKRQKQIVRLMSQGLANKQIAYDLHISETTVKTHVSNLFQAFGVYNRLDCVRKAQEMGLLE